MRAECRARLEQVVRIADNGVLLIMKDTTKRSIVRWIHIICSIPIIGYIYSPFEAIPDYAPATRFVFVPVMLLSGLWMWKGRLLRRLIPTGTRSMRTQ
jgi:hypothetical protein